LAALSASKPGVGKTPRDVELEAANAEIARLSEVVKELAVKELAVKELAVNGPIPRTPDMTASGFGVVVV